MKITPALAAAAALVALSGGGPDPASGGTAPASQPEYTLVDLGAVTAAPRSEATAINDKGVVVGDSFAIGSPLAATVWRPDAGGQYTAETLPNLAGGSLAADVNDAGLIVGYSGGNIPHGQRAVLWQSGNVSELGFPTSVTGSGSVATAINDDGKVVGYADGVGYQWDAGTITAVGNSVFPQAINGAGQLTGRHSTPCCDFA